MESSTPSGLTIVGQSARSIAENVAPNIGSATYAPGVVPMPWAGWPDTWDVPRWDQLDSGLWGSYVSTVYTCTDLIARTSGSFPIYRMRGVEHMADVPWMGNPEPELYDDWAEFLRQLINSLYMRGESIVYALARYTDGTVARMAVLNPDTVNVEWANGAVRYEIGGRELDRHDVWHHKYQSWPGAVRGISPLSWVGRNLVSADAMERYQAQLATGGGVPWAVLTAPGNLTREQADTNRQSWVEAAARRGAAPVMLGGGLTLDTLTLSPTDMALLDLRVFDEQRICAALGVPPYLVGLPQAEGLTYANATSLFDYFWRSSLRPLTRSIAAGISRFALAGGQRLEFNADEFTRPDFAGRAQSYAVLHGIVEDGQHAITVDEIRQAERFTTDVGPTAGAALSGPITAAGIGEP